MKSIPLPDGMIVTSRIHIGKLKCFGTNSQPKIQLHRGHINSSVKEIEITAARYKRNHFVAIIFILSEAILCTNCQGRHEIHMELVMN